MSVINEGEPKELSLEAKKLQLQRGEQPEIPHITANYVSLSHITSNLVLHCYAELQNLIETLPSVSSDFTRKRRLLDFIIRSRQEFVKLYVLAKWATVWKEISKCIDVVSWLNGQQNCFNNVINLLYTIERDLGGAKLRNPDLETALEVLTKGQPTQKSHDFIPLQNLSPKQILNTLQDLNVLLSIRLALIEQLPPRYRNYTIADGRVKFTVPNCFSVDLGIADSSVDARFFLVDFNFCFDGASAVSLGIRAKLDSLVNDMLANKPLSEVFNWLLKFTQSYKLSTIHERTRDLERGLWAGVLKHLYYADRGIVAIQYWVGHSSDRNIIEVGLTGDLDLGVQWVRDSKLITDHNIEFGNTDMDVERLIRTVIATHVNYIVETVYDQLATVLHLEGEGSENNNELVSFIRPDKIRLQLTGTRHTVFSIDQLTGRTVLQNPTQLVLSAERSLNDQADKATQSAAILLKLRDLSLQDEIASRAVAAGWVANTSISIPADEVRKHFSRDTKLVLCLRQPAWTYRWYLVVTIGGNQQPKWWLSQLEAKDNVYSIRYIEHINLVRSKGYSYDYDLFDRLKSFTSTRIKVQSVCRELESKAIKYSLLQRQGDNAVDALPVLLINTDTLTSSSWAQSSLIVANVPKENGSAALLVQGRMKKSISLDSMPSSEDSSSSGVVIDPKDGKFFITIDDPERTGGLVQAIMSRLARIERVVKYVDVIRSQSLTLKSATMSRISFEYGGYQASLVLKEEGSQAQNSKDEPHSELVLDRECPHYSVLPFLQQILLRNGLTAVIWLLINTLPLYKGLEELKKSDQMKLAILPRSVTDLRVAFLDPKVSVELKMVNWQRSQMVIYVSELAEPGKPPTQALKTLWETKQKDIEGSVPLVNGMSCPPDKIGTVLQRINSLVTN